MGRKPKQLTPEEIEVYDKALESTNGVMNQAAKVVGVAYANFKSHIYRNPTLSMKWGKRKQREDPSENKDLHRPIMFTEEQKAAIAEAKETKVIQGGLKKLGYNDEELDYLAEVAQCGMKSLDSVLDLTIGGLTKTFADQMLLLKKLKEKLTDVLEHPDDYYEVQSNGMIIQTPHKVTMDLVDRINAISKETRHVNTAAEQGRVTRYKIEEIRRTKEEENKTGKRQPGFNPFGGHTTFVQNNFDGNKPPEKKAETVDE